MHHGHNENQEQLYPHYLNVGCRKHKTEMMIKIIIH